MGEFGGIVLGDAISGEIVYMIVLGLSAIGQDSVALAAMKSMIL